MLVPNNSIGTKENCNFSTVEWLQDLPKDTFYALWLRWPNFNLPTGYNLYVVSFHLETVDVDWVNQQAQRLDAPILLLSDLNDYNYPFLSNVYPYTYYYWHHQIEKIKQWFPNKIEKNLQFKASALCNRITQSKIIIFTALAKYLGSQSLLKLDNWLEEKNVHFREKTGIAGLDELAEIFWSNYYGIVYKIDNFNNTTDNIQIKTADPYSRAYTECSINFTNESFHYSYMVINDQEVILPGPFLTEKTFKCLVGDTPFIAVGQFETYKTLENLGFQFDYGPLDLSWDSDAGNLSRLVSIVDLIGQMQNYNVNELSKFCKKSSNFNFDYIWSGDFLKHINSLNEHTVGQILREFK